MGKNRISRRDGKKRPFVIAAEGSDAHGTLLAVPVGVVLATCTRNAWQQAIRRWPQFFLMEPGPWEVIPPHIRLAALEADRLM